MVRRGQTSPIFDMLLSLIFIGFFAITVFYYVLANANGEEYFARFYTADLATSAEIVNAGYGDVVLRYDNLKPNLDLRFWFDNGKVGASMIPVTNDFAAAVTSLVDIVPKFFSQVPAGAAARTYGIQTVYQSGPAVTDRPVFLVLRKSGDTFSISESETELRDCPRVGTKAVPQDAALIYLGVDSPAKDDEDAIRTLLKNSLSATTIKTTDERAKASIIIELKKQNGEKNEISVAPTSSDGQSLGCIFTKRVEAITSNDYEAPQIYVSGTAFELHITITTKDKLTNEQIAQAIVTALAVYYK
jgi:hypothetical protein